MSAPATPTPSSQSTKSTKSAKPTASKPASAPKKTKASRHDLEAQARAHNPPGILVVNKIDATTASQVAGYLGLETVAKLKDVLDHDPIKRVWKTYSLAKLNGWGGVTISQNTQLTTDVLWNRLKEHDKGVQEEQQLQAILMRTLDIQDQRVPGQQRDTTFIAEFTLTAIYKLLRRWPGNFPNEGNKTTQYYNFAYEDWNRCYFFLRFANLQYDKKPDMQFKGKPAEMTYLSLNDDGSEAAPLGPIGPSAAVNDTLALAIASTSHTDRKEVSKAMFFREEQIKDFVEQLVVVGDDENNEKELMQAMQQAIHVNRELRDRPDLTEFDIKSFLKLVGDSVNVRYDELSTPQTMSSELGRFMTNDDQEVGQEVDRDQEEEHNQGEEPGHGQDQVESTQEDAAQPPPNTLDDQMNEASDVGAAQIPGVPQDDQDVFRLRRDLADTSSPYPSLFDAAKDLNYSDADIKDRLFSVPVPPELRGKGEATVLTPLQVVAVSWMGHQHFGKIGGGILAMDCGTGKTITILTHIARMASFVEDEIRKGVDMEEACRPSLILCPNEQVLTVWYDEWRTRFPHLHCRIFHGSQSDADSTFRKAITYPRDALQALARLRSECPSNDAKSCRYFVLSTYSTWASRTLRVKPTNDVVKELMDENAVNQIISTDDGVTKLSPSSRDRIMASLAYGNIGKAKKERQAVKDFQSLIDDDALDEGALAFSSVFRHRFASVFADEGHHIKNTTSKNHKAMFTVYAPHNWISSATPANNSIADFLGALNIFWNINFLPRDIESFSYAAYYLTDAQTILADDPGYLKTYGECLWKISPRAFAALFNTGLLVGQLARNVLLAIQQTLVLRLTVATEFQLGDTTWSLSQNLRPYRTVTVELEADFYEQNMLDDLTTIILPALTRRSLSAKGGHTAKRPKADVQGLRNTRVHRHLCLTSTDIRLHHMNATMSSKSTSSQSVATWHNKNNDHGATFYFQHTLQDPTMPVYTGRIQLAQYVVGMSPKLRYVCRLLLKHVFTQDEKVVIWYFWPIEGWLLHMLLTLLCIPTLFIGSQVPQQERSRILKKWDNPDDSVKVLIASIPCIGDGVNMQHGSHISILMSITPNLNQHIQVVGRQHRYGQKHDQTFYVLTLIKTYDQILQAKSCQKMLLQLLGEARLSSILDPSDPNTYRLMDLARETLRSENPGKLEEFIALAKNDHLVDQVDKLIQKLLGMSGSRLHWHVHDVHSVWRPKPPEDDDQEEEWSDEAVGNEDQQPQDPARRQAKLKRMSKKFREREEVQKSAIESTPTTLRHFTPLTDRSKASRKRGLEDRSLASTHRDDLRRDAPDDDDEESPSERVSHASKAKPSKTLSQRYVIESDESPSRELEPQEHASREPESQELEPATPEREELEPEPEEAPPKKKAKTTQSKGKAPAKRKGKGNDNDSARRPTRLSQRAKRSK